MAPASAQKQPRVRVGVLIVRDAHVLLVKHRRDEFEYWLLPGGGLDWGESIAECAVRECKEEMGLDVEVGDLIAVTESLPPGEMRHIVHLVLRGTVVGGTERVGQDDARLVGMQWHALDAWRDLTFFPPIRDELLAAARGAGPALPNLGPRWEPLE